MCWGCTNELDQKSNYGTLVTLFWHHIYYVYLGVFKRASVDRV